MSLSNSAFDQYIDTIYPPELDIKYTTDSPKSSWYLDLLLSTDANMKSTISHPFRNHKACVQETQNNSKAQHQEGYHQKIFVNMHYWHMRRFVMI